jgi:hypothetical protein
MNLWDTTFREAAVRCAVALAIGGTVVGVLAGCAQGSTAAARPTTSPSPSTEVSRLAPALIPVDPPASARDAFVEANRAVNDDSVTLFLVLQRKISGDLYGTFEAGGYRAATGNTINDDFEDTLQIGTESYGYGGVTGRAPLWFPSRGKSSASPLIVSGQSYPYGVVHLSGCFKDRRVFLFSYLVSPGSPTPTPMPTPVSGTLSSNPLTPTKVTVQYQPAKRVWLITNETTLPGNQRVSLCPAGKS